MAEIGASVGLGGVNEDADVRLVQDLLNAVIPALGRAPLLVDGDCSQNTILAIQAYQARVVGLQTPDGRIDPGGRTWTRLVAGVVPRPAVPKDVAVPFSGAAWWDANQAKFPNSARLDDLAAPFRDGVKAFTAAMRAGGARISVASTLRNPVRAKLMLFCWEVSRGQRAPGAVPALPGCDIAWDHGDLAQSQRGAAEMVRRFGIVRKPSTGTSRHTEGRAIDMTISWSGTITVADANGALHALGTPRSGENNADLHRIGRSYGVIKFAFQPPDPPHWSDDGH